MDSQWCALFSVCLERWSIYGANHFTESYVVLLWFGVEKEWDFAPGKYGVLLSQTGEPYSLLCSRVLRLISVAPVSLLIEAIFNLRVLDNNLQLCGYRHQEC